jgi:hypothetical protein
LTADEVSALAAIAGNQELDEAALAAVAGGSADNNFNCFGCSGSA